MSGLNVRVTGRRVVAALIDVVILGVVARLVFAWDPGLSIAVVLLVVVAYYTLMEGITGRTVGKYATGIRVSTRRPGGRPGSARPWCGPCCASWTASSPTLSGSSS